MKIRNGFVSNSSSSSFVIYGKIFTKGGFMKRSKLTKEEMKDICENGIGDYEDRFGGLECIILDEECREFLFGESIKGNSEEIYAITKHIDKLFGPGCKLFKGVDSCGVVCLDEE